eukprot:CAMPEP_0205824172 /NCGR_PEP_ID=MMETSP0206-20130828/19749_1 /ASSEMBLY_ACC=CAM_ASM_000279 /TAXON_ID=36767 /ORGANISM="Euplotes focardii, Strain TN1" /LENGTH=204 /DNA_ID=CAMNT_0053122039 /DNA_START=54 /DNA_END=664 /DNA_ORIENTATION=-
MALYDRVPISEEPGWGGPRAGDARVVNYEAFEFPGLTFRSACRSDIPRLVELHDALFEVKYPNQFFESLVSDAMVTILAFARPNEEAGGDGPVLVGVGTARRRASTRACLAHVEGYIATLGVIAGWRNRGLGQMILEATTQLLLDKWPDCDTIALHVKASNAPAIRMYQRGGFMVVKNLPKHYYFENKYHDAYKLGLKVKPGTG